MGIEKKIEWNVERYREVETKMYELRQKGLRDTEEYEKLITERALLERAKLDKK